MSDKNIDKDIELLREMQLNGVKAILNGGMYKDEKAELKVNAIENVLSELETYKKIAEVLALRINELDDEQFIYCKVKENEKCDDLVCHECIIDWARKEVEKDD